MVTINDRFKTNFTIENMENNCKTLKAQYVKIKKEKELSDLGWANSSKKITFYLVVAFMVKML